MKLRKMEFKDSFMDTKGQSFTTSAYRTLPGFPSPGRGRGGGGLLSNIGASSLLRKKKAAPLSGSVRDGKFKI